MSKEKPQFTPGPWRVRWGRRPYGIGPDRLDPTSQVMKNPLGHVFRAHVQGHENEQAANARLIAAAPELYDMLTALIRELDAIDHARQLMWSRAGSLASFRPTPLLEEARALRDKILTPAEGESEPVVHTEEREMLKAGAYSVFVLCDDGTWEQPTYRIDYPMSVAEFRLRAEKECRGFLATCVGEDNDCPPDQVRQFRDMKE